MKEGYQGSGWCWKQSPLWLTNMEVETPSCLLMSFQGQFLLPCSTKINEPTCINPWLVQKSHLVNPGRLDAWSNLSWIDVWFHDVMQWFSMWHYPNLFCECDVPVCCAAVIWWSLMSRRCVHSKRCDVKRWNVVRFCEMSYNAMMSLRFSSRRVWTNARYKYGHDAAFSHPTIFGLTQALSLVLHSVYWYAILI